MIHKNYLESYSLKKQYDKWSIHTVFISSDTSGQLLIFNNNLKKYIILNYTTGIPVMSKRFFKKKILTRIWD